MRIMEPGSVHEALMLALKYEHKWKAHLRKKEFRKNYFGNTMDKNQIGFKGGGLSQGYGRRRNLELDTSSMTVVRKEERDQKIASIQAERQRKKEANLCFRCGDK